MPNFSEMNFLLIILVNIYYFFAALAVGHALLHKRNPRAALSWTVTILFLPGIGLFLYISFGIGRADSRAAKLMRTAKNTVKAQNKVFHHNPNVSISSNQTEERKLPPKFRRMSILGEKLTGRYLCAGNDIQMLENGDAAYPAMIESINAATQRVYMTTYIFNGGETGSKFCDALIAAVQRGVDVRVIVDGLGARLYSFSRPWKNLSEHGIQVAEFLPPRFFPPNFAINLRNHRKVLVADDIGFTGGMNIADYHVESHDKFSVQDVHFMCKGAVVWQLYEAFLWDWAFCTNEYTTLENKEDSVYGDTFCRIVLDGPGSGKDPLHELLYGAVSAAKKSIFIMTPYFLPTQEFMASLKSAALRGVDINIILPIKNNIFYVHWATYHLLPTLLESGINIWYQPAPFVHSKLFMVDNYYVQIGSANLDSRSLRLNFELNVECFDTNFAKNLHAYFLEKIKISTQYTMNDVNNKSLLIRLRNAACWLFSPYL